MSKIMKVVILCGGLGTRISEETINKPKPMVKIGRLPILHHIINYYIKFNFTDFIILTGYKANIIKNYFAVKNVIKNINIEPKLANKRTLIVSYAAKECV